MFIYYNKNNIIINNILRLFKLNSVLLKYNNEVYKYVVLYKLLIIQCFLDEEYVIVEEETNEKIEDDWSEINFYDDDLK
jgi:hypothetical protein